MAIGDESLLDLRDDEDPTSALLERAHRAVAAAAGLAARRSEQPPTTGDTRQTSARLRAEAQAVRDDIRARRDLVAELQSIVDNLQIAMQSRAAIEQAKGILMAAERCSPDEAFDVLRRASQRENRKLREIAEEVVARTAAGRPAPVDGDLPGARGDDPGTRQA